MIDNVRFYNGTVANHPAILAISGVGLVNPTIATTVLLNHYHPQVTVMLGSAGGIRMNHLGDVAIGSRVFNLEFGTFDQKDDRNVYPASEQGELYPPSGLDQIGRQPLKPSYAANVR